jgi:hypothetical protein
VILCLEAREDEKWLLIRQNEAQVQGAKMIEQAKAAIESEKWSCLN